MGTEYKRLVEEFHRLTRSEESVEAYLRGRLSLMGEEGSKEGVDWRCEFREAYKKLTESEDTHKKLTVLFEQLLSYTSRLLQRQQLQLQLLQSQLTLSKTTFQQQKLQLLRLNKDYQQALVQQRQKTLTTIQQLQEKQFQLIQLQQKVQEYQEEIQEIKSAEYQNMMNSIKEEEILCSQAQSLMKENVLLRQQVKECTAMNNTLNKLVAQTKSQLDSHRSKYSKMKRYIKSKLHGSKRSIDNPNRGEINLVTQIKDYEIGEGSGKRVDEGKINLIQIRDNFSFRDSIDNQNHSVVPANNPPSFCNFDSGSQRFYASQQSPTRALMQREILHLTERDLSTYSRDTKQFLRTKTNLYEDKENVSENTWDYQDLDNYHNQKLSRFGSKRNDDDRSQKEHPSNCSVDDNLPIARGFETQQRVSLLSKQHRRGNNTSFYSKHIQQFREYDNTHFIINTEKLTDSMIDNLGRQCDGIMEQSKSDLSCSGCEVNEIVINEDLLSSCKRNRKGKQVVGQGKVCSRSVQIQLGMIDAKFVKSVQVRVQPTLQQKPLSPLPDMYYAFFSLTAQCAKLNHKNFNEAISVYFNLQQEYSNVLNKMIPINKWYNYIQDQIQMSLKYKR